MLQPGQLRRQSLVRLDQVRNLPGHRSDLPTLSDQPRVLSGDPVRLRTDEHDQLIAGHLFRRRHPKTPPHPRRSNRDRHAVVTHRYPIHARTHARSTRLNVCVKTALPLVSLQ